MRLVIIVPLKYFVYDSARYGCQSGAHIRCERSSPYISLIKWNIGNEWGMKEFTKQSSYLVIDQYDKNRKRESGSASVWFLRRKKMILMITKGICYWLIFLNPSVLLIYIQTHMPFIHILICMHLFLFSFRSIQLCWTFITRSLYGIFFFVQTTSECTQTHLYACGTMRRIRKGEN